MNDIDLTGQCLLFSLSDKTEMGYYLALIGVEPPPPFPVTQMHKILTNVISAPIFTRPGNPKNIMR